MALEPCESGNGYAKSGEGSGVNRRSPIGLTVIYVIELIAMSWTVIASAVDPERFASMWIVPARVVSTFTAAAVAAGIISGPFAFAADQNSAIESTHRQA